MHYNSADETTKTIQKPKKDFQLRRQIHRSMLISHEQWSKPKFSQSSYFTVVLMGTFPMDRYIKQLWMDGRDGTTPPWTTTRKKTRNLTIISHEFLTPPVFPVSKKRMDRNHCWWKKSCTTWDVLKNAANNGIDYQPQLVQDFWSINSSICLKEHHALIPALTRMLIHRQIMKTKQPPPASPRVSLNKKTHYRLHQFKKKLGLSSLCIYGDDVFLFNKKMYCRIFRCISVTSNEKE